MTDKDTAGNLDFNNWIRRQVQRGTYQPLRADTQATEPVGEAQPRIPPGNAGSGAGSPPAAPLSMSNAIRRAASGRYSW